MTTRRITRTIALFVLLLTAAVIGGSFYMLGFSLRPEETMRAKNATAYEYMYAEYPFLRPWTDSLERAGALRDTVIVDPQGVRLHALYAAAPEPTDRTAVIVHGYTDCAVRMLMIGYLYNHDLRYNILLPDLHYHGRSEGRAIRMGWLDRLDVLRWMEVANALFGGNTQIVLNGVSMGAATTMLAAAEESLPACVRCAVEDCGYTSTRDIFADSWEKQCRLPLFPLFHLSDLWCRILYGWSFAKASPLDAVHRCRLPMLFIHGDKDSVVPVEMVHRLYEAKIGDKELWILSGVDHGAAYLHDPQIYAQRVRTFVEHWFECPAILEQ